MLRFANQRLTGYRPRPVIFVASLFLIGACGTGANPASSTGYRGSILPEPQEKVAFTLADTDGQPFDFVGQTDGFVTLLFFGYTHCPDVCPIHMANIGAVLEDFPYDLRRQFKVVFVTTDPERDTAERLRSWLNEFDPSFIGLRGDQEEVSRIQIAYGLPAAIKQETEGGEGGYLIGHSARVLVFTRDNRAHVAYPFGTRQADWAHDLPKLAAETWGEG